MKIYAVLVSELRKQHSWSQDEHTKGVEQRGPTGLAVQADVDAVQFMGYIGRYGGHLGARLTSKWRRLKSPIWQPAGAPRSL
jgi:hypothetical protein